MEQQWTNETTAHTPPRVFPSWELVGAVENTIHAMGVIQRELQTWIVDQTCWSQLPCISCGLCPMFPPNCTVQKKLETKAHAKVLLEVDTQAA